jgi:hypothetical protein
MYAVVNHLYLNKPLSQLAEEMDSQGIAVISKNPGFRDLHLVQAGDDHAIVILLWETRADAENGARSFGPTWFAEHVAPFLTREQQRSAGNVISTSAKEKRPETE